MLHLKVHLRFNFKEHLKLHKNRKKKMYLMVHLTVQSRVHLAIRLKVHLRMHLAIIIKMFRKVHLRLHLNVAFDSTLVSATEDALEGTSEGAPKSVLRNLHKDVQEGSFEVELKSAL